MNLYFILYSLKDADWVFEEGKKFGYNPALQFVVVIVTKDHKLGGLKHRKFIVSQFWSLAV